MNIFSRLCADRIDKVVMYVDTTDVDGVASMQTIHGNPRKLIAIAPSNKKVTEELGTNRWSLLATIAIKHMNRDKEMKKKVKRETKEEERIHKYVRENIYKTPKLNMHEKEKIVKAMEGYSEGSIEERTEDALIEAKLNALK